MTVELPPDFGPALHRSSPVPLWAQVEESIDQAIVDGRLAPGQRLEPEARLCRRFSVSRPTLRQALTRLRRRGLVTGRPGSGTFISPALDRPALDH
jgi:DNA-binding GntR family transcriptional regulator